MTMKTFRGELGYRDDSGEYHPIGPFVATASNQMEAFERVMDNAWDDRLDSASCTPVMKWFSTEEITHDRLVLGTPGEGQAEESIHRYPTYEVAAHVARYMRESTDVVLYVKHDPVGPSESEQGVGDWVVGYFAPPNATCFSSHQMMMCARAALEHALADALAEHDPDHFLAGQ